MASARRAHPGYTADMFHSGHGARGASVAACAAALLLGAGVAGCSAEATGVASDTSGPAATSSDGASAAGSTGCVEFAATTPETVEVSVRELASSTSEGLTLTPLTPSLVAGPSGVFWFDSDGAVFGLRRDDTRVRRLREALPASDPGATLTLVHGIATDGDRLIIGEAHLEPAIDYIPLILEPPGRLISIPTAGGEPTVLLELEDGVITPIASDNGRLIVFVQGENGGFFSLDEANQLQRLPLQGRFFSGQRSGSMLYASDGDYPATLLRSSFDDAASVPVLALEMPEFYVGPSHLLVRVERLVEPEYTREQTFVVHEIASGCTRTLPGLGESVAYQTAVDADHVYWVSYRTPETTTPEGASGPDLKLIGADLSSGALTRLAPSGVELDSSARIIGQDDETLYVINGSALLAIDKP